MTNLIDRTPPVPSLRSAYGPDPDQFCELWLPAGGTPPYPVLVTIHGGYWRKRFDLSHMNYLCAELAKQGVGCWNLEYRREGWSLRSDDVFAGFRHLDNVAQANGLDVTRLAVAGFSAGGQLAMLLAAEYPKFRAVVSLAGVLDLERVWALELSNRAVEEYLGGSPEQVPDRYQAASPMHRNLGSMPQVLVHGDRDESVPLEISQRYARHKQAAGEHVSLIEVPGATHFDLIDPESAAWPTTLSVLLNALGLQAA